MKFWLQVSLWVVLAIELVVTFLLVKRVRPWWWGLRQRTRVLIALVHVAAIVAVSAYANLG